MLANAKALQGSSNQEGGQCEQSVQINLEITYFSAEMTKLFIRDYMSECLVISHIVSAQFSLSTIRELIISALVSSFLLYDRKPQLVIGCKVLMPIWHKTVAILGQKMATIFISQYIRFSNVILIKLRNSDAKLYGHQRPNHLFFVIPHLAPPLHNNNNNNKLMMQNFQYLTLPLCHSAKTTLLFLHLSFHAQMYLFKIKMDPNSHNNPSIH